MQMQNILQSCFLKNIIGYVFLTTEIRRKIGSFIWEQDQDFLTEKVRVN